MLNQVVLRSLLFVSVTSLFGAQAMAALQTKEINSEKHPFVLQDLPYAANSLMPYLDEQTMNIHHGRHHKAYVDNLNKGLEAKDKNLGEILSEISKYPTAIRNNGGGHWNHRFFWSILTPDKAQQKISNKLERKIRSSFGNMNKFKEQFEAAATSRFGSGWAWLIVDQDKKLKITSTANQDNPLMDTESVRGTPILGVDVWEHAYYLKYQNQRAAYLKEFWNVVNWSQVEKYLQEAGAL